MAPAFTSHGGVTFSLESPRAEGDGHFLDACFLCGRPLLATSEVFMYRGDIAFCTEDCRQEQIELDEAREWEISYRRRLHHRHHASPVEQAAPPSAVAAKALIAT